MDKKELKTHLKAFQDIVDEFSDAKKVYNNGSNKAKRTKGFRKMNTELLRFTSRVENNAELYELITEGHGEGYSQVDYWKELKSFKHFGSDMPHILDRLTTLQEASEGDSI